MTVPAWLRWAWWPALTLALLSLPALGANERVLHFVVRSQIVPRIVHVKQHRQKRVAVVSHSRDKVGNQAHARMP